MHLARGMLCPWFSFQLSVVVGTGGKTLGGVGFIIPSRHCLVQESISGAWVLFSRGGVDLLSLCIPLGLWDSAVPKGEPQPWGRGGSHCSLWHSSRARGFLWILPGRFPCLLSGIHQVSELLISLHSPSLHPVPLSQMYLFKWL